MKDYFITWGFIICVSIFIVYEGIRYVPLPVHQEVGTTINPNIKHIAPDYLYPNEQMTPGKAETLNFNDLTKLYDGQTYSAAHRAVSDHEKTAVCNEYPQNCKSAKEIDHFYPLCAGGSNDIQNLWAQPEVNQWNGQDYGYHLKDKLETWVCSQIKAGKLDPKTAFQGITQDWIKFYQENLQQITKVKTFGAAVE